MTTNNTLMVDCPSCHAKVAWSDENPLRPFCSESCKNKDFIGWANEEKKLSGSGAYDDIFSEQTVATDDHPGDN